MAYTAPNAADFKARFPEFAAVPDPQITAVLGEVTTSYVDDSWREADYAPAIMYYTAHLLAQQGVLAPAGLPGPNTVGPVTSFRLGDASVGYGSRAGAGSGSSGSSLDATFYGQEYQRLLRANRGGPRVV